MGTCTVPLTKRQQNDTALEVIARAKDGDQQALAELFNTHKKRIYTLCLQMVGDVAEAEDLTQDVFLKLYRALDTFDRRANFQTWLISVSRNLCIDHYRSMRREHDVVTHDVDVVSLARPSAVDSPQMALEQRDRVALLRAALDKLAPSLRTAVMLRDIQELSYHEIADRLRLPEGTVKSRINRGRTELARQIQRLRDRQDTVPRTGVSG